MKYSKAALPIADLLARWRAKGLHIPDTAAAERALTFVGYFRLRGYALPLMQQQPSGNRVFKAGVSFADILARYELDRDLRRITLGQLERIEVAMRTVISNQMSLQYGPFWYLNHPMQVLGHATGSKGRPEAFSIGSFLGEVERETHRSKDLFAQHYFNTYTDPLLPPSWLMAECLSFGKWSKLYKHLQKADPAHPNPKKEVAKAFGAVCTPDFFLFDKNQKLVYRGRLDDSWKEPTKVNQRDLFDACTQLYQGKEISKSQRPSMGCSIKWKGHV